MLKYHIQTVELTSGQGAISFNSIPQDFTDLYVSVSARATGTGNTLNITFNQNTSGYTSRALQGSGSTTSSFANFSRYSALIGMSAETTNTFGSSNIYIPNYTSSSNKSYSSDGASENNGTTSYQAIIAGSWSNSSPITSVAFSPLDGTFIAGSSISLYGVRRGSDGVTLPAAIGGTVTTSGGYTIHTFNTSGTFSAFRPLECEYLVIAGGGGGGASNSFIGSSVSGAGGGAGGYRSSVQGEISGGGASAEAKRFISLGERIPVVIGAGGAGGVDVSPTLGTSGSSSSFYSIPSIGGGGGGGRTVATGADGGSGGGGAFDSTIGIGPAGLGTPGQGFAGAARSSEPAGSGGGGGAGQLGFENGNNLGGNGGAGVFSLITGTSQARAGGGAGGAATGGTGGTGGIGGGGNGGANGFGVTAGSPNTGGGGGGGGGTTAGSAGGNGGSGVVIIRYLTP